MMKTNSFLRLELSSSPCSDVSVPKFNQKLLSGSSHRGAAQTNPTRNHEVVGSISSRRCGELWCRSQTRPGFGMALAVL